MTFHSRSFVCCLTLVLLAASPGWALGTDQFTVPPAPLADIGAHLQQRFHTVLQQVASDANIAYLDHRQKAKSATFPWDRAGHAAEADRIQAGNPLADAFREAMGPALIECEIENWLKETKFPEGNHLFDPSIGQSIYGADQLGRPVTLLYLSPTINLFGHYCGTDKVGHFVDQGYEYFERFRTAEREGKDAIACVRSALERGVYEERTIYGLMIIGVYSNADLSANYAGMKFYLNLTRPVMINGRRLPPMLVKRQELWEINRELPHDLLRPFISDHFNESLNPSFYSDQLRETVRKHFPERAARWAAFYHLDPAADAGRLQHALTTFYGEPYGHSGDKGLLTAADMLAPARPAVAQHTVKGSTSLRE